MPRHERRLTPPTPETYAFVIPRNYRLVRNWTQEIAAAWYGVSVRTWQRYETTGAPRHVLTRIRQWTRRTEAGKWHAAWLC